VIPEIDIWRVANLMLKRYGDQAEVESANGCRNLPRMATVSARRSGGGSLMQLGLVNTTPPGPMH